MSRLIIAGGGLAGCLAALALAKRRPEIDLLLVEQAQALGGNHIWSFFDTDLRSEHRWLLAGIEIAHWPEHEVRFPRRRRAIGIGYNSIRSAALDSAAREALTGRRIRFGSAIAEVGPTHVQLATGERIEGDAVLDARGAGLMTGQDLGWQKFVGRLYRFPRGHGTARPVIMDATVPQRDGYRFLYLLPFSETELLLEDTYYSADSTLDREALGKELDEAACRLCGDEPELLKEESGVLPIVVDGDFDRWWPSSDPVARIGIRGGFFHPTTSYSLPDAVANAAWLADQHELKAPAIASRLRARAERQWRERAFFQALNRMLFRASLPNQSYRVLEHFYRLPPEVIARFYSGTLRAMDKVRILSGRPPVPIGRALSVLFGSKP